MKIKGALVITLIVLIASPLQAASLCLPADKVMRISPSSIEFEHHGVLPIGEGAEAYQHWQGETWQAPLEAVKVGFQKVAATLQEDQVIRLDVYDPLYIQTMRVALTTDQFQSLAHRRLVLAPTSRLFVEETGTGRGFIVQAGETATAFAQEGKLFFLDGQGRQWEFARRLYLWPEGQGMIQINSFQRGTTNKFHPRYRGRLELTIFDAQSFLVINEVGLEEYLYQVVPSEMPINWPLEALKAQAVAARTYAVAQAIYSRQGHLGFHVSDDTSSQVYNNQPESAAARQAIEATAGQILVGKEGTITSAYFYSTSPGSPFASVAAWEKTRLQPAEGNSPWFRWQSTFTAAELNALFAPAVGEVTGISVQERDAMGRVVSLEVEGPRGKETINGELEIRAAFKPATLQRMGDTLYDQPLLPSAFFLLQTKNNGGGKLEAVTFFGGGSGHGLGMSQWGAKGLAEEGYDYQQILSRYYPDSDLTTDAKRLRY